VTSLAVARLWLRTVWASVPTTYATLLLALTTEAGLKLDAVSAGLVAGTSANGHSVQFSTPDKNLSAEDWAETASALLDLYDTVSAVLISSGITSPTDAQIYAEMIFRLQNVGKIATDFTQLRQEATT
jgi:hypothetical protein